MQVKLQMTDLKAQYDTIKPEVDAAIQSVIHDIVPPTINHFTDDPELDQRLNYTFHKPQQRLVRAALSNTFGFGGHNACIIVKKFLA